ncbi:MAG: hypothetical protein ABI605_14460 [Rhizobacter sp.]
MYTSLTRSAFLIVVLAAVGASVFRVSTAPERVRERRDTARSVCVSSGGQWIQVGRDEICQKEEQPSEQAQKT